MRQPGFAAALRFAQDLIRIPGGPGEEGGVAARVREEMEALGFDDVWIDGAGNVIGRVRGTVRQPAVMLSSHLDVVDVGDPAAWERDPFSGDIADGWLHGRGAMDIKGPLAVQTHAAATFLASRPPADLFVAHTVLEERGGWGMAYLLESGAVQPAAVIIGEATNGDICIGHRGRAEIIIQIEGVAGHASAPERARNPLAALPGVLPAIDRLASSLGSDPLLGRSTLVPTAIETMPASRNVIPDRARIVLDWRVLPDITADAAVALVDDAVRGMVPAPLHVSVAFASERQRTWTGLERDRQLFTPGFQLPAGHPIAGAAVAAVLAATGVRPVLRPWTFATDGGHTCGVHGIPTLGYAPGEERFAHTSRERLRVVDAERVFSCYPGVIAAVQGAAAIA
jgi:succinyl-diaminopimelate desuccinylase